MAIETNWNWFGTLLNTSNHRRRETLRIMEAVVTISRVPLHIPWSRRCTARSIAARVPLVKMRSSPMAERRFGPTWPIVKPRWAALLEFRGHWQQHCNLAGANPSNFQFPLYLSILLAKGHSCDSSKSQQIGFKREIFPCPSRKAWLCMVHSSWLAASSCYIMRRAKRPESAGKCGIRRIRSSYYWITYVHNTFERDQTDIFALSLVYTNDFHFPPRRLPPLICLLLQREHLPSYSFQSASLFSLISKRPSGCVLFT